MSELKTGYIIHASTGCTCCSEDNFVSGIYETIDEAKERVDEYRIGPRLASQFASRGRYSIQKIEYEELYDGRVIMDDLIVGERYFGEYPTTDFPYLSGEYVSYP